jgi:NADPH2:quinone reductase
VLEASGGGVDRAVEVEFGRNAAMLAEVLRPSATVAAYGSGKEMAPILPFGAYLFKAITIDIVLVYILNEAARANAIERLHAALHQGGLNPAIDRVLPLARAAEAHDAVMTPGRAGAVLLTI